MTLDVPARRLALVLAAILLPSLWLLEIAPTLSGVTLPWSGHPEGFHLESWLPGDCPFYRATARSLLHGDLDLRDDAPWDRFSPDGQVAIGARGEWYPKHPLGLAIAALPFFALLGDRGLLLFNLIQVLALDVLLLLAARRFASDAIAFSTALLFALGTLLRPAANNFSPDVFSTLLVFAGYLALVKARGATAGALLGAAVVARWTNLTFLPVAVTWAFIALERRQALRLVLTATPFLCALGLLNWHMFGSPWVTPYDRVGTGLLSTAPHLEPSHRERFDVPFFRGLYTQLFDRKAGLLRSAPPVVLGALGMGALFRRRRSEAWLVASFALAQLAFFAPYRDWSASSYGHRFLLTVVALAAVPAAAVLQKWLGDQTSVPLKNPTAMGQASTADAISSVESQDAGRSRSATTEGTSNDSAR